MSSFPNMQVYIDGRTFRQTAQCDCGWTSAVRWTRGSASVDAGIHTAQTGHGLVSAPLVGIPDARVLVLQAS